MQMSKFEVDHHEAILEIVEGLIVSVGGQCEAKLQV